jgi:uncharacterized protein YegJ (DUF2314 family)
VRHLSKNVMWLSVWLSLTSVASADPNISYVPKSDPAMTAAFARAAATLDQFFKAWHDPPAGAKAFAVKIGLADSGSPPGYTIVHPNGDAASTVEWFWVVDLQEDNAGLSGQINNAPEGVRNVSLGQTIHFSRSDIGDWMYFKDGKVVGDATACPALAHSSPEDRRQMEEQYGLFCN